HFHHNTTELGGGGVFYVNETAKLTFKEIKKVIGEFNYGGEGGFAYFGSQYFRFNDTDVILTSNTSLKGSGGALYLKNTDIIFDNIYALLEYNHSASSGGAIYAERSTVVFDNIDILDFRNNSAIDGGGVFYVDANSIFGTIGAKEINALYNTAGEGGFIYFEKRSFHFSDMKVLMDSNRAESNPNSNNGGAFTFYASSISFNNDTATFQNNYAGSNGGVIYTNNGTRVDFVGTDVLFYRNTAGGMGGGLAVDNHSTVSFASAGNRKNKISFIENSATLGGILSVDNHSVVIFDGVEVEFVDNYSEEGGGMYVNNGSSVIFTGMNETKYSYNTAISSGGAIFIDYDNANVVYSYMKNLLFSYNTAEMSGGAIYINNFNTSLIFAHIDKLSGIYNTADHGGFGFFANQNLVYFDEIPELELLNNTAYNGNGGAIYLTTAVLRFLNKDTQILNNVASKFGGGIYSQYANIDFLGETSVISTGGILKMEGNTAHSGGAIYSRFSGINFNDREIMFGYNIAAPTGTSKGQGSGGALYLINSTVNFSLQTGGQVKHLSFIGNTADSFGAIYVQDSVVKFNNIELLEFIDNETMNMNTSTGSYGGVFGSGNGKGESIIDIGNVGFLYAHNNKANRGGFLYLNEAVQDVNIMTIEASSNTAKNGSGGAIYIAGVRREVNIGGDLTNRDTLFIGNRASADGGAIYAIGITTVNINAKSLGRDVIFRDNESGAGLNDVFTASGAVLSFNVESDSRENRKIELHGGIGGEADTVIRKTGEGLLYIAGKVDYYGLLDLRRGVTRLDGGNMIDNKASLGDVNLGYEPGQFSELELKTLGLTRMTLNIRGIANINGKLTLSANAAKGEVDKILVNDSGEFNIGDQIAADLNVVIYGGIGSFEDTIIEAAKLNGYFNNYEAINRNASGAPIIASPKFSRHGVFVQDTYLIYYDDAIKFGGKSRSNFGGFIAGLTHNQSEAAKLFDRLDNSKGIEELVTGISILAIDEENERDGTFKNLRKTLDKISGSFIIRSIMSAVYNDSEEIFYSKIREIDARDKNRKLNQAWIEGDYNQFRYDGEESFTLGGTDNTGFGFRAGSPIKRGDNSLTGIYAGYESRSLTEEQDTADISEIEAGFYYGKYFGVKTAFKGNIGASLASLDINRKIELPEFQDNLLSNFNTLNIMLNGQLEYTINAAKEVDIKPYIGLKNTFINNAVITDSGGQAALEVAGGSYLRTLLLAGLRIEDEKGAFRWALRGYGGYTLIGARPEYEIRLINAPIESDVMKVRGMTLGAEVGVGASAEYIASSRLSVFAGGNFSYGLAFNRLYLSAGITYRLGQSFKDVVEFSDEEEDEYAEDESGYLKDMKFVRLLAAEFEFGKYNLTREAVENIKAAAEEIKRYNYTRITVEGNADVIGEEKLNKSLSIMRARAVYEELYRNGIPLNNMRYIDFKGSADPIASNMTEEGRARNRRAEIVIEYPDDDAVSARQERLNAATERRQEQIRTAPKDISVFETDEEIEVSVDTASPATPANRQSRRLRTIDLIDMSVADIERVSGETENDADSGAVAK
ncbi:MAG: autotransporter domain-containing protein, partial [Elusimicrobiota bacterium]|nr:autotransporter domain-containing protein [Elusimicrobiota bacterium]